MSALEQDYVTALRHGPTHTEDAQRVCRLVVDTALDCQTCTGFPVRAAGPLKTVVPE